MFQFKTRTAAAAHESFHRRSQREVAAAAEMIGQPIRHSISSAIAKAFHTAARLLSEALSRVGGAWLQLLLLLLSLRSRQVTSSGRRRQPLDGQQPAGNTKLPRLWLWHDAWRRMTARSYERRRRLAEIIATNRIVNLNAVRRGERQAKTGATSAKRYEENGAYSICRAVGRSRICPYSGFSRQICS